MAISIPQVGEIGNMTGLAAVEWLRGFREASEPRGAQPYMAGYAAHEEAYKHGYDAGLWVAGRWTGN